ncbi:hypothetical protein B0H13DRAFT_2395156, partial [Mycena leptocephala]
DAAKARSSSSAPPHPCSLPLPSSFTPHPNTAPLPTSERKCPILPIALFLAAARRPACLSEPIGAGTGVAVGGIGRVGARWCSGGFNGRGGGRAGGMRSKPKRQTHIQILAPHEEPIISALHPQPPPSFRLTDAHTYDRAINKYTGTLPSSRSTSISHNLAHCRTRAQCRTYYNSTSISSSRSPPSPSISSIALPLDIPIPPISTRLKRACPPSFLFLSSYSPSSHSLLPVFGVLDDGRDSLRGKAGTQCARTLL